MFIQLIVLLQLLDRCVKCPTTNVYKVRRVKLKSELIS